MPRDFRRPSVARTFGSLAPMIGWAPASSPTSSQGRHTEFDGTEWRRAEAQDTTDLLRRIVTTIAHDSLLGRPTPGPQLDQAAQFIAREFGEAGLSPLGDDGGFLRRYPVVETILDETTARIEFGEGTT